MRTHYPFFAAAILSCSIQAVIAQDKPASSEQPEKEKEAVKAPVISPAEQLGSWLGALRWRPIGPTSMGGRIVDLAIHPQNPDHFFVATASGGLFKTVNGGVTFEAQFQHEASISIGDICLAPSQPDIIWLGTGENNGRNSVSWGDGVYKSTDGGKTWKNMGLKESFQTGRILIHPEDPNIVYVGAVGRLWGNNEQRGIFKTVDGGTHWEKVLYIDDMTGCIELAMHPQDPDTLLAAMYERRRDPFDGGNPVKRYGAGSGLYKSTDAGATWKKLTEGLPTGKLGRIAVNYLQSNPDIIYALLESEEIGKAPPGSHLPALMGIQGNSRDGSATLTTITKDGAAEKAQLKKGDLVTETGLWVSLDRGNHWNRLNNNLPHVAVHEIAIHPTAGEIVAATHGRSLWILNITTLRQMNPKALKQPVHFFKPHTAVLWQGATGKRFYGSRRFVGTNPPTGSQLTYALQKPVKRVQLTVTDIEGKVVGQLKGSNKAGLHQINWNLRQRKSNGRVKSGTYLVTLNADGEKTSHPLTVIQDPVYPASTLTFDESERLRKLKKVTDD